MSYVKSKVRTAVADQRNKVKSKVRGAVPKAKAAAKKPAASSASGTRSSGATESSRSGDDETANEYETWKTGICCETDSTPHGCEGCSYCQFSRWLCLTRAPADAQDALARRLRSLQVRSPFSCLVALCSARAPGWLAIL